MRRGFSLMELLVVVATIALLMGILATALRGARESARGAACLSNLRSIEMVFTAYADENRGRSPVLGVPYGTLPNWALVVQSASGIAGESSAELYAGRSVLVCPSARARYGPEMQRTYAVNVTGHAGAAGDPDNYDQAEASIRLDRLERPGERVILVDSAPAPIVPPAPPPTRTASVLDFRSAAHVTERLGWVHASGRGFMGAMGDGSARGFREVGADWSAPLP